MFRHIIIVWMKWIKVEIKIPLQANLQLQKVWENTSSNKSSDDFLIESLSTNPPHKFHPHEDKSDRNRSYRNGW